MSQRAWERYRLSESMEGKSFLDVGCYKGSMVREALSRGASMAIGIDMVSGDEWKDSEGIYYPMDVLSPNFLGLPRCDIVVCAGVLYHVHDPVGLLRRLHMKTREVLLLETAISMIDAAPILEYCPEDSFDNNHSNWFLPNMIFLNQILEEVGFEIGYKNRSVIGNRVHMQLKPIEKISYKLLPRRKK